MADRTITDADAKGPNFYNAPKIALVDFINVRYAVWQCEGPDCGAVLRTGRPAEIKPLDHGETGNIRCSFCGQRLQIRRPHTIRIDGVSTLAIHDTLERFRKAR